jgi:hypothetical protein
LFVTDRFGGKCLPVRVSFLPITHGRRTGKDGREIGLRLAQ